jgi:hypothetical protein
MNVFRSPTNRLSVASISSDLTIFPSRLPIIALRISLPSIHSVRDVSASAELSKSTVATKQKQSITTAQSEPNAFLSSTQVDIAWKGMAAYHILLFAGMVLAPQFTPLRRFLSNLLAFIPPALTYCLLLANSWRPDFLSTIMPGSLAEGLSGGFKPQFFPNLLGISTLFQQPQTAASWIVHALALNLFLGRLIFLDAAPVPRWHSLLLASFFGPFGYLSHLITKAMMGGRKQPHTLQSNGGSITLYPY